MPPSAPIGFTFLQSRERARTLPVQELTDAAKAFAAELKERQGHEKYQPAIPARNLN